VGASGVSRGEVVLHLLVAVLPVLLVVAAVVL
jgi:hypothetical protein